MSGERRDKTPVEKVATLIGFLSELKTLETSASKRAYLNGTDSTTGLLTKLRDALPAPQADKLIPKIQALGENWSSEFPQKLEGKLHECIASWRELLGEEIRGRNLFSDAQIAASIHHTATPETRLLLKSLLVIDAMNTDYQYTKEEKKLLVNFYVHQIKTTPGTEGSTLKADIQTRSSIDRHMDLFGWGKTDSRKTIDAMIPGSGGVSSRGIAASSQSDEEKTHINYCMEALRALIIVKGSLRFPISNELSTHLANAFSLDSTGMVSKAFSEYMRTTEMYDTSQQKLLNSSLEDLTAISLVGNTSETRPFAMEHLLANTAAIGDVIAAFMLDAVKKSGTNFFHKDTYPLFRDFFKEALAQGNTQLVSAVLRQIDRHKVIPVTTQAYKQKIEASATPKIQDQTAYLNLLLRLDRLGIPDGSLFTSQEKTLLLNFYVAEITKMGVLLTSSTIGDRFLEIDAVAESLLKHSTSFVGNGAARKAISTAVKSAKDGLAPMIGEGIELLGTVASRSATLIAPKAADPSSLPPAGGGAGNSSRPSRAPGDPDL